MHYALFIVLLLLPACHVSALTHSGDVTGDGVTSIADLVRLVLALQRDEASHTYVDLGLPSGTLWATCNVGGNSPSDYGGYYAWGETKEKGVYSWSSYFDSVNGSSVRFHNYSTTAATSIVGTTDDVARVQWGPDWQMPTLEQYTELKAYCRWTSTQQDGVAGMLITGRNGNSIFMPRAGNKQGSTAYHVGTNFYYWAGELYCLYDKYAGSSLACYMDASGNAFEYYGISRINGFPVRAVVSDEATFPDFDINGDGRVDLLDVDQMVAILLQQDSSSDLPGTGDWWE